MKKLMYLIVLSLILGLVLTGCSQSGITYSMKGGPTETEADEYILYAGQDIPVGTVNVWNDLGILYVRYVVDDPWEMTGSHLYVGKTDPFDFPSTPGQLPYSPGMEKSPSPNALYDDTTMTYTIPLAEIYSYVFVGKGQGKGLNAVGDPGVEPCDEIYISAQAEVFRSYELVNPGAEDGMNGWTYTIDVVRAIDEINESTGDLVLPKSGEYFFDMSETRATLAEMSQGVSVAGFDGTSFKASGWIQTEWYPEGSDDSITANDYGRLVVTFYDNSNDELESFTTVPIGNPVYSLEGNIPDGAVTAIYELHGTLVPPGTFLNVFYDDLSFEYWQEETAWAEGDNQFFGKNWATYFTYNIAGEPPFISSDDLDGPFTADVLGEFHVRTVNPECGFAYSNVLFNYTIFDIELLDIASFEYFDGTIWHSLLMAMSQDGDNVTGYYGPLIGGFPLTVPYSAETKFRINILEAGEYTVEMTLDNLNPPFEQLAFFTEYVVVLPETLLEIGDSYGGGIVAYILQSGDDDYDPNEQHGLIAATGDQSTGIQWYNGSYEVTGATGTAIGTGQANTTAIVTKQGAGSYAAQLCDDLIVDVYNDWFLPSKDELDKLYSNKDAIDGFADEYYWSSSEYHANFAWIQDFDDGFQYFNYYRHNAFNVRAVRAF
jgi:hypothetical protein